MLIKSSTIGIIADDLTGANDTALQFHLRGCNTQILLDYTSFPEGKVNTQGWAISTETRNISADKAGEVVKNATRSLIENLNIEHFYKKIDSTLRGNIGQECLAMLEELDWDAAVVLPAFPCEGRTTVGGYHLLKGIPVERTEVARDPQAPIYESFVPGVLAKQVENNEVVGQIELDVVMRGAGPIIMEMTKLIKEGKKLIVVDAVSTTDIEQVVLAIEKSNNKILPCGSAGLAQALAKVWLSDMKHQHISKVIQDMPKLVVSGSATNTTQIQLKKLAESDDIEPFFIELSLEDILNEPDNEQVDRIISFLGKNHTVVVCPGDLEDDLADIEKYNLQSAEFIPTLVTDYLATLTQKVLNRQEAILILVGGETSYKCCNAINSKHLQLIDEVESAIPLCLDHKAQWIVTKSGNLGTTNTLINILKYFEKHK